MDPTPAQRDPADPFQLDRFVQAQAGVHQSALTELKRGRKETHWMWFIFPQFEGLGKSAAARFYAIKSRAEAEAYLAHPVLGARLLECTGVLLAANPGRSASDIFGFPDDLKLRSSMTLFASVSPPDSVFARVLEEFFGGEPDAQTLELLRQGRV